MKKRLLSVTMVLALLLSLALGGCRDAAPVINDDPENVGDGTFDTTTSTSSLLGNVDIPTDAVESATTTSTITLTTTSTQDESNTQQGIKRVKAQVKIVNGMPRLFLDGKQSTGNMFFINADRGDAVETYKSQINHVKNSGIHMYSTNIYINYKYGDNANPEIVFNRLANWLRLIIEVDPKAKIMLRVAVGPASAKDFEGDQAAAYNTATSDVASLGSDEWFDEAAKRIKDMVKYIRNSPEFADHVFAYHLENWEWFDPYFTVSPDVSAANSKKFREWLKNKYGTDAKLKEAWGQGYSLATAEVPKDLPLNSTTGDTIMIKDGDARFVDFLDYWNELTASRIEMLAKAVKEASNNESLVLAFYGYYFEQYHATTGHWDFNKLLNSPYLDGFASPTSYMDRSTGNDSAVATSGYMTVADTVTRAGKLWYMESDQRTFINRTEEPWDDGPLPSLKTIESIWEVHKREVGMAMIHGTALYPMDLAGMGWYDYDEIWTNFAKLDSAYEAYSKALKKQTSFDVAMVVDERAQRIVGSPSAFTSVSLAQMMLSMYRTGTSFCFVELQDVLDGKVDDCSMYIFVNPYRLSSSDIDKLSENLHKGNKTSLFLYGFGSASAADVKKLTGMEMETINEVKDHSIRLVSQSKITGLDTPRAFVGNPLTVVKGLYTTALGQYSDGSVGYALYEGKGYRTIFLGTNFASTTTLRAIAKLNGVRVFMNSEDVLNANDTMVMFNTSTDGDKTVNFGKKTDVYDYFTGKWYMGVTSVTFKDMRKGQVKWLFYGKKADILAMKLPKW